MGFEVAYDPGENIRIVQAVQKHPVIYNIKKYPPVEYRCSVEKAWASVSSELGFSEGHCKGRWTNIKGCFKRYLRNKAQTSSTKTYYLADYLEFMLPFMNVEKKWCKKRIIHDEISNIEETKSDNADSNNDFEVKLVDSDGEEESFFISPSSNNSEDMPVTDVERSADWDFFSSLLPDIQRMDPEQKSKFRNALLTAIDMALYGEDL